jgi:MFS family permease
VKRDAGSLWRHGDFLRLWAAQAVSAFGSRITRTALPIIAVTTLHQTDAVVSLLMAMQLGPGIFVGLFAGGFIDRSRKRRILIAADLIRAIAVGSLTIAWAAGVLDIIHVMLVGAAVGAGTALFSITDNTYLPALIGKKSLAEGNAKLESTEAIAEISGPASAGWLIAVLGAPLAVVIDAFSYVWSAVMLGQIRTKEPKPPKQEKAKHLGEDLRVGLRVVFQHPVVRPIVLSHMVWSISGGFFMALYTPYCLRVLGLSTSTFGVIVGLGGVGSLAGAVISRKLVARMGLGRTLLFASITSLAFALLIPLAGTPAVGTTFAMTFGLLAAHQLFSDGFAVAFVIQAVTLRQTVLPKEVLGRANAAIHVCTSGLLPVAAVIAGGLAELFGTRTAVWIGVMVGLLSPLLLLPLRKLKEMPSSSDSSQELPLARSSTSKLPIVQLTE